MAKNSKSLGEYLDTTVLSELRSDLEQNRRFIVRGDGAKYFVLMQMDVMSIPNAVSTSNKDFGGVLELVRNGRVKVVVTDDTNSSGKMMFIPTPETLTSLQDYSMFRDYAEYEFVGFDEGMHTFYPTGIVAEIGAFAAIAEGSKTLDQYVSIDLIEGEPEDSNNDEAGFEPIGSDGSDMPDDDNFSVGDAGDNSNGDMGSDADTDADAEAGTNADAGDDNSADTGEKHSRAADMLHNISAAVANVAGKAKDAAKNVAGTVADKFNESTGLKDMNEDLAGNSKPVDNGTDTYEGGVQDESNIQEDDSDDGDVEERVIPADATAREITRLFNADDLELELSTDAFDQLFTVNNELILFDSDQRDGFVNGEMNRMAADANRDLTRLRAEHIDILRRRYIALVSLNIKDIQKKYDTANLSTDFGSLKHSIDEQRDAQMENIDSIVAAEERRLNERYESDRESYAQAAYQKAIVEYNQISGRQHSDDIAQARSRAQTAIQADYAQALAELDRNRRREALTDYDLRITAILQTLIKEYEEMQKEENEMYQQKADEMREYANQLHQEDAKRIAIEESKQHTSNEINVARAEAAQKIETIQREFETASAAIEARAEASIASARATTDVIKQQLENVIATNTDDRRALEQQLADAQERADRAREIVEQDYEHRLAQANDDIESWKKTLEVYEQQHKHNNRLSAILVIAIVIACLAGGFVTGGLWFSRIVPGADNNQSVSSSVTTGDTNDTSSADVENNEANEGSEDSESSVA